MKVGDLVVVVKPQSCCGDAVDLGLIFSIVEMCDGEAYCRNCGALSNGMRASGDVRWNMGWYRLSFLKVIPPLNELEAEKAVETV